MAEYVDSPRGRRPRPRSLDMSQIPAANHIEKVSSPRITTGSSDPSSPTIDSLDNAYRHVSPKPLPRHSLPTLPENSWLRNSSRSTSSSSKDGKSPRRYSYQSSNKRSSLSFPIQPDRGTANTRPIPVLSPTRTDVIASLSRSPSPTGSKFLTAVAAQERRVLELREELQKAERELINLKKQFATHEASRKRNDPRRPQQLQNMETALSPESSDDDRSGSSRYMHREMEKRKALLNGVRPYQRTVFSGSRHARALSLLSPERTSAPLAFPRPNNQNTAKEPSKCNEVETSLTSPTLSMSPYDSDGSNERFRQDGINKEVIVRTGKQMASDLRQGLWTFLEDLRQATVGDEGISPTRARGSHSSLISPKSRSPHRIGYHNHGRKHLVTKSTPNNATFSAGENPDSQTVTPNRTRVAASPILENLYTEHPSTIPEHSLHDNNVSNSPALPSSTGTAFSADSISPTTGDSSARTSMSSNPLDFIPAKPSYDGFDDLTVKPSVIKPRPTVLTHFEASFVNDVRRRVSWPNRMSNSESVNPTMSFGGLLPGGAGIGGGSGGSFPGMGNATAGMSPEQIQEQKMIKTMQAAMESCPVKTVISGGMGFALGGMFGLFMSSMRYDTPLTPAGATITNLPVREQLRRGFKDMARSSYGSARNFGVVGAMFAGTECCIEGFRARNDLSNGVAAGCITGGVLAAKAGPQAAALGCAGFAAFSAAIDYYMRMPPDEGSVPIV